MKPVSEMKFEYRELSAETAKHWSEKKMVKFGLWDRFDGQMVTNEEETILFKPWHFATHYNIEREHDIYLLAYYDHVYFIKIDEKVERQKEEDHSIRYYTYTIVSDLAGVDFLPLNNILHIIFISLTFMSEKWGCPKPEDITITKLYYKGQRVEKWGVISDEIETPEFEDAVNGNQENIAEAVDTLTENQEALEGLSYQPDGWQNTIMGFVGKAVEKFRVQI